MRQLFHIFPAIAGDRTDDVKVEHGSLGIRDPLGNFFGKSKDIARLSIPLGQKVVRILSVVVIIVRLESGGLVKQFARARFAPTFV